MPVLEYRSSPRALKEWQIELASQVGERIGEFHLPEATLRLPEAQGYDEVFSFVHVSDVQIRDFAVRYHGTALSRVVDSLVKGTERVQEIDKNDEYPFIRLVHAINSMPVNQRPLFMMHTGDALEVSTPGELLRFLSIANSLEIPWLNVIGNHDILIFGNFSQRAARVDNVSTGFDLVRDRLDFMLHHGGVSAEEAIFKGPYGIHGPTVASTRVQASRYHGFDSGTGDVLKPYYSLRVETGQPDLPIRILALDTTVADAQIQKVWKRQMPGTGAGGYIDENQFAWLDRELAAARGRGEAVLVFGHHPLTSHGLVLKGESPLGGGDLALVDYLVEKPHVLAYFGGHTHKVALQRHVRRNNSEFAEVIAPSLHEFPQVALRIALLRKGSELAIQVTPFDLGSFRGSAIEAQVQSACRGSMLELSARQMARVARDECRPHGPRSEYCAWCGISALKETVTNNYRRLYKAGHVRRPLPVVAVKDSIISICESETKELSLEVKGQRPIDVQWSDGLAQRIQESDAKPFRLIKGSQSTTLTMLSVSNTDGEGRGLGSVAIDVKAPPTLTVTPPTICAGEKVEITAVGGDRSQYEWSPPQPPGTAKITLFPTETAIYHAGIIGCRAIRSWVQLDVRPRPKARLAIDPADGPYCPGARVFVEVQPRTPGIVVDWLDTFIGTDPLKRSIILENETELTIPYRDGHCPALQPLRTVLQVAAPPLLTPKNVEMHKAAGEPFSLNAEPRRGLTIEWFRTTSGAREAVGVGLNVDITNGVQATTEFVAVAKNNCGQETVAEQWSVIVP